jgi:hypothetical protein
MGERLKSKLEIEQQKKIERVELEKMFDYNPFGRAGAGAPLKDSFGNTLSSRKTIETTLWKDQTNPHETSSNKPSNLSQQQNINVNPNLNYAPNYSQPYIPQYIIPYHNPQGFNPYLAQLNPPMIYNQPLSQENPYIPKPNNNIPQNSYNPFFPNQTIEPDYYLGKNGTIYSNPSDQYQQVVPASNALQNLTNQTVKPQEIKNNPQPELTSKQFQTQPPAKSISQEESEKIKRLQYQNVLLLQIEENKRRKEEEKQKQWEANKLEDLKIKEYHDKLNEASKKEQEKRLRCISSY